MSSYRNKGHCIKFIKNYKNFWYFKLTSGWPLVMKKSGMFDFFCSRSGKSQGILQIVQGIFKYQESQGKAREFHNWG